MCFKTGWQETERRLTNCFWTLKWWLQRLLTSVLFKIPHHVWGLSLNYESCVLFTPFWQYCLSKYLKMYLILFDRFIDGCALELKLYLRILIAYILFAFSHKTTFRNVNLNPENYSSGFIFRFISNLFSVLLKCQ